MTDFIKNELTQIHRKPDRGDYDRQSVFSIIDEALYCQVGIVEDGHPVVIPTLHGRIDDTIYLHGAKASRLLKHIQAGSPVCLSMALMDGIVFARSVFEHSINYRSVVIFGKGRLVDINDEKLIGLKAITDHIAVGRWEDARQPTQKELDATMVVAVQIESASAKIHQDMPKDNPEDLSLPVWAGVLPLSIQALPAQTDPQLTPGIELPEYLRDYRKK